MWKEPNVMTEIRELFTSSEVAEIFRVDPKTVTRWANAGRFDAAGIRRYLAQQDGGQS
jgi:hypothetical protein